MSWVEVLGIVLLFSLVIGMSATVDVSCLNQQLHNNQAIVSGLVLQFMVLPLLGFAVVRSMHLDQATGIALLVVTSSPGGSFSNWWCSVFNADLALSITMTAISTLFSIVLMPLNLYVYCKLAYAAEDDILETLHWGSLILTLCIVLLGIGSGLALSALYREPEFHMKMNRIGTAAGLALIVFSAVLANVDDSIKIWNQPWQFYVGTALPCIMALLIATIVVTVLDLEKPERVTVAIEACYQNTAIATSVAINMFNGQAQARAVAVPLFYGVVEAVILSLFCVAAWKAGWTKAPRDASLYEMLVTPYEVLQASKADIDPDYMAYVEHHHQQQHQQQQQQSSPHESPRTTSPPSNPTDPDVIGLRHKEFSAA